MTVKITYYFHFLGIRLVITKMSSDLEIRPEIK